MARIAPTWGIGIPDLRLSPDTETAQGTGGTDSSYTEAGPEPGRPEPTDPVSTWRPHVSGAQSVDLTLVTIDGGVPGRAGVAYRLASESASTDYRSACTLDLVTGWSAPAEWQDQAWNRVAAARDPDTHRIVVIARPSGSDAMTWLYDPRSDTWTAGYDWSTGPGLDTPIALAYDPTHPGRVLLWSGAGDAGESTTIGYYSDDHGTTWHLYTRGQYDVLITAGRGTVAVDGDGDWLAFMDGVQLASSDAGSSWEEVGGAGVGSDHQCVRAPDGWHVIYLRTADDRACRRILASPRVPIGDAAEEILSASAAVAPVIWCDDDGVVGYDYELTSLADPTAQHEIAIAACGARYTFGGVRQSAVTNDVHVTRYGGWSQVENGYQVILSQLIGRWHYGYVDGVVYLPYDTPAATAGWTETAVGGTIAIATAPDVGLRTRTTAAAQIAQASYPIVTATAVDYVCGEAEVVVDAGAPAASSGDVYVTQSCQDGAATGVSLRIYLGPAGLEVRDGATTVRATATVDTTDPDQPLHLRWQVRSATPRATVWYRRGTGSTWTRVADEVTLTSVAIGATTLVFGCPTAGSGATAWWRFVGAEVLGDWRYGVDGTADAGKTPVNGPRGLTFGRTLPTASTGRVAVPDATSSGESIGYLAASGGATRAAETVELPAGHAYPSDAIYPGLHPSPRRGWRSTSPAEARWIWDQGADGHAWYGGALALAVLRADCREVELSVDDGAGGWTVLGTADKGWDVLYTLSGSTLVPRSGTTTIDRYLAEGELVGGYVVCSTGGGDVARRIVRQSAGYWTTDAGEQQVRITIEGADGTEDTSGTGEIVHHSGVLVVYPTTAIVRRYVRVRIPAAQEVVDGKYTAGLLAVCRLVGVGTPPSWDWTESTEYARTTERRPDGTLVVREAGPPRRVRSAGWTDGVDLLELRLLSRAPDYVATASGQPIGTEHDSPLSVLGLVEHSLSSGATPALIVHQLPSATTTITDPTLYLWSRLSSDRVGIVGIRGTEGVDEWIRADALAWEEIR